MKRHIQWQSHPNKTTKKTLLYLYLPLCPWSQKLEQEAFSLQRFINLIEANFYPIKIDQHDAPDLFAQYTKKLSIYLKGQHILPGFVIETAQGEFIHGGGYHPPNPTMGLPSS